MRKRSDPASILERYSRFRPTSFDAAGLRAETMGDDPDDADRSAWLVVPIIRTRDSGALDVSNFVTMERRLAEVDPDGADHESHRFGHWGPGWFEILIVRPGTQAAQEAADAADALADYPILDESDLSEREAEAADEDWNNYLGHDVRRALASMLAFDVDLDDVDLSDIRQWVEMHADVETHDDGTHVSGLARALRREADALLTLPGVLIDGRPVSRLVDDKGKARAVLTRAQRASLRRIRDRV